MSKEYAWSDDLDPEVPIEEPVSEYVEGGDSPAADLGKADKRIAARAARPAESLAFERELAQVLHPDEESEPREEGEETPLTIRLAELPVGDPAFEELRAELLWIANERSEKAASAAFQAGADDAEPDDTTWNANDLTALEFRALSAAATGGSRQPPVGTQPREWRLMLRSLGIGA